MVYLFMNLFVCMFDLRLCTEMKLYGFFRGKKGKEEREKKMFTCIACTKQTDDGGEEGGARGSGTPSTKEAVKSLTAQVPNQSLSLSVYACLLLASPTQAFAFSASFSIKMKTKQTKSQEH